MTKKLLKSFCKDRALFIVFYLFNITCIIMFFHLYEPANKEFIYPFSISLFLLSVYLVTDWLRYYGIHLGIEKMLHNEYADIKPHTEEQKRFWRLVEKLNREHTAIQTNLNEQNKERLYFLSHWMHYLKTPVSVIALIVNREEQSGHNKGVMEKIKRENDRLHSSIEQGLAMIRMENFESDLEIKSVDLLVTIRKIINERKRECIYQSIFPLIDFEGENAFVATDSKWNEVMLEQIISNAIKYSSYIEGNKKLIFRVEEKDKYTILHVKDEGVGIPPYDVERVFQPFFTGENGREYPNSSGIGLYLCKKIADKLEHQLDIRSQVSRGTTVSICYMKGQGIGN